MSWFKGRTIPEVTIEDNRFTIADNPEAIRESGEPNNLPAIRQPVLERPAPKVGVIPQHSWGA